MRSQRPSVTSTVVVGAASAGVIAVVSCVIAYSSLQGSVGGYGRMLLTPEIVNWPLRGSGDPRSSISFLLGLLLFIFVVGTATWLGARAARIDGGAWAVASSAWLGAVVGSTLSGLVSGLFRTSTTFSAAESAIYGLVQGPYAGLFWGLPIAVTTAVAFRRANREAAGATTGGQSADEPAAGVSPFDQGSR